MPKKSGFQTNIITLVFPSIKNDNILQSQCSLSSLFFFREDLHGFASLYPLIIIIIFVLGVLCFCSFNLLVFAFFFFSLQSFHNNVVLYIFKNVDWTTTLFKYSKKASTYHFQVLFSFFLKQTIGDRRNGFIFRTMAKNIYPGWLLTCTKLGQLQFRCETLEAKKNPCQVVLHVSIHICLRQDKKKMKQTKLFEEHDILSIIKVVGNSSLDLLSLFFFFSFLSLFSLLLQTFLFFFFNPAQTPSRLLCALAASLGGRWLHLATPSLPVKSFQTHETHEILQSPKSIPPIPHHMCCRKGFASNCSRSHATGRCYPGFQIIIIKPSVITENLLKFLLKLSQSELVEKMWRIVGEKCGQRKINKNIHNLSRKNSEKEYNKDIEFELEMMTTTKGSMTTREYEYEKKRDSGMSRKEEIPTIPQPVIYCFSAQLTDLWLHPTLSFTLLLKSLILIKVYLSHISIYEHTHVLPEPNDHSRLPLSFKRLIKVLINTLSRNLFFPILNSQRINCHTLGALPVDIPDEYRTDELFICKVRHPQIYHSHFSSCKFTHKSSQKDLFLRIHTHTDSLLASSATLRNFFFRKDVSFSLLGHSLSGLSIRCRVLVVKRLKNQVEKKSGLTIKETSKCTHIINFTSKFIFLIYQSHKFLHPSYHHKYEDLDPIKISNDFIIQVHPNLSSCYISFYHLTLNSLVDSYFPSPCEPSSSELSHNSPVDCIITLFPSSTELGDFLLFSSFILHHLPFIVEETNFPYSTEILMKNSRLSHPCLMSSEETIFIIYSLHLFLLSDINLAYDIWPHHMAKIYPKKEQKRDDVRIFSLVPKYKNKNKKQKEGLTLRVSWDNPIQNKIGKSRRLEHPLHRELPAFLKDSYGVSEASTSGYKELPCSCSALSPWAIISILSSSVLLSQHPLKYSSNSLKKPLLAGPRRSHYLTAPPVSQQVLKPCLACSSLRNSNLPITQKKIVFLFFFHQLCSTSYLKQEQVKEVGSRYTIPRCGSYVHEGNKDILAAARSLRINWKKKNRKGIIIQEKTTGTERGKKCRLIFREGRLEAGQEVNDGEDQGDHIVILDGTRSVL
ncbi:hypothetical protein VP01_1304g3 [Puccinia sorghi]|uniref:Uncharacterized protein n=1 Tax=Puccinia sorghi TaxID=27349 RepID=A0A0L6VNJ9_9BASI|nr:hypothetical protein VP01_1304g3 [Puccinia sorghi]